MTEDDTFRALKKYTFNDVQKLILSCVWDRNIDDDQIQRTVDSIMEESGWTRSEYLDIALYKNDD